MVEALKHGGFAHNTSIKIRWISAEDVTTDTANELLAGVNGIVVPGGFGHRGTEGKLAAIKYAREHNIPYLGLCLGMQLALVEFS